MTVATPGLDGAVPASRRGLSFDSTWFLWAAIIAVLLFLVVSPFVYLVVTSFSAEGTGEFTFANYAAAYDAWRQKAHQTVDNAEMRYFIVHLHRLLDPDAVKS